MRENAARVALSHTESGNVTPSTSSPPTAAFGEPPKKREKWNRLSSGDGPIHLVSKLEEHASYAKHLKAPAIREQLYGRIR